MFPACPGSVASFYQWSRGVQIRANLDLLMDWIQSVGLGDVASEFLQKLSAAVNLLATPKETLLQVRGASCLRGELLLPKVQTEKAPAGNGPQELQK